MFKSLTICLFILGFCFASNAQQVISTSGGESSSMGGSVSYTIGQVSWSNVSTNDGAINEGVQQPYDITVMPTGEDVHAISPELFVYPNPVNDYLMLKVKDCSPGNLSYVLYDQNGKLLVSKKLYSIETIVPMDNLARSVYLLKVLDNYKEVRTFKIVKN